MRLFVPLLMATNFHRMMCNVVNLGNNSLVTKKVGNNSPVKGNITVVSVKHAIFHYKNRFFEEDVPEPELSILYILSYVLKLYKLDDVRAASRRLLDTEEIKQLDRLATCRLSRMPIQYLVKQWDFRKLSLLMYPSVFIPRPETEELVEVVLDYVKKNKLKIDSFLEVGSGSGAISLSLLQELPSVNKGYAIDQSIAAYMVTKQNALICKQNKLRVYFARLDENGTIVQNKTGQELFEDKIFDFIVSNPPYIPQRDIIELAPEIRLYEDYKAYNGGVEGMDVIKPLMVYSANKLQPKGSLFMEIDDAQPNLIRNWTEHNYNHCKLKLYKVIKDINGFDRFVHLIKE